MPLNKTNQQTQAQGEIPYTQATNLTLCCTPLAFTTVGPLSDRRHVPLSNVNTGGPFVTHWWHTGGCCQRTGGVAIGALPLWASSSLCIE